MDFWFRTDASLQIGTGHVMRCLTLAKVLRDRGATCKFICRNHGGNLLERIRQDGFEVIALPLNNCPTPAATPDSYSLNHADWLGGDWQTDAARTIDSLGNCRPNWLVVDHYALDARWEAALRPYCGKIMVIDDLADRDHDCDLLLDQNLVADMARRYDQRVPAYCARLIGPEYALLQSQYAELHLRAPSRKGPIRQIFVFFGGVDSYNLTGRAISAFLALSRPDIALHVVINPASSHAETVREQVKAHTNINLYGSLPSLAPLMLNADLAIGAGGATSWERCCLGLPSLVITLAENQLAITTELHRLGFVRWLGSHNTVTQNLLQTTLQNLLQEGDLMAWSSHCKALVDGQGGTRTVDKIYSWINP